MGGEICSQCGSDTCEDGPQPRTMRRKTLGWHSGSEKVSAGLRRGPEHTTHSQVTPWTEEVRLLHPCHADPWLGAAWAKNDLRLSAVTRPKVVTGCVTTDLAAAALLKRGLSNVPLRCDSARFVLYRSTAPHMSKEQRLWAFIAEANLEGDQGASVLTLSLGPQLALLAFLLHHPLFFFFFEWAPCPAWSQRWSSNSQPKIKT